MGSYKLEYVHIYIHITHILQTNIHRHASSLLILPPLFSSLLPLLSSSLLLPLSLQRPLFSSYFHCRLCSPRFVALSRLVLPPLVTFILGSYCHNYCDKKITGMHKKYTHGHNTYIHIHMQCNTYICTYIEHTHTQHIYTTHAIYYIHMHMYRTYTLSLSHTHTYTYIHIQYNTYICTHI